MWCSVLTIADKGGGGVSPKLTIADKRFLNLKSLVGRLFQAAGWKVVLEKPVEYWVRPVARVYSRWLLGWWASMPAGTSRGRQSSQRAHTVLSTVFSKVTHHYHTLIQPADPCQQNLSVDQCFLLLTFICSCSLGWMLKKSQICPKN